MPEKTDRSIPPRRSTRPPTRRQREVLRFIGQYTREHGYSPSIRDIAEALDITSTNGVFDLLNSLARRGYISREIYVARSIVLLRNEDGLPYQSPLESAARDLLDALAHETLGPDSRNRVAAVAALLRPRPAS